MIEFLKYYFDISHDDEGYRFPRSSEITKVSRKARMTYIIVCYIIFALSFLVFFTPLELVIKSCLWLGIIVYPISYIYFFDFSIIKIIRLYLYSKSKNINKNIIYQGYVSNKYIKLCYKVFSKYKKKRIVDDLTSFRCVFKCFWDKVDLSFKVTPYKVIIKLNGNKEVIKHNKKSFEDILLYINEKINQKMNA